MGAWELFPGTYVVGIKEIDRYIQVPAEKRQAVMYALSWMDGQHTLEEISHQVHSAGWSMDIESLYRKAGAAGLLVGIPFIGELRWLTLRLGDLRIAGLFRNAELIRQTFPVFVALAALSLAGAAIAISYFGVAAPHLSRRAIFWRPLGTQQWIVVLAGILLSILFHEGAHAITAVRYELIPSRIRVLMYLGIIPYVVLSIPGLYTIPPRARLKVWIAGPIGSLTAACTAQIGLAFVGQTGFWHQWLVALVQVNLLIAISNFFPLLPTDGYFILCTLVRTHNLRLHGWQALAGIFRRRRPALTALAYGVCAVGFLAFFWQRNVFRILHFYSYSVLGYAVVVGTTLLLVVRQIRLASERKSTMGITGRKRP